MKTRYVLLGALISLSACSSKPADEEIIAEWRIRSLEYENFSSDDDDPAYPNSYIVFNSDATWHFKSVDASGTSSISGTYQGAYAFTASNLIQADHYGYSCMLFEIEDISSSSLVLKIVTEYNGCDFEPIRLYAEK